MGNGVRTSNVPSSKTFVDLIAVENDQGVRKTVKITPKAVALQVLGDDLGVVHVSQAADLPDPIPSGITGGRVYIDPDPSKDGQWVVEDGAWTWVKAFPRQDIELVNNGDGTGNSIVATPNMSLPSEPNGAYFNLKVTHQNTGNVTINDGEAVRPLKTRSGGEVPAGVLLPEMMLTLVRVGGDYRSKDSLSADESFTAQAQISMQDALSSKLAAENARDRAELAAALTYDSIALLLAETSSLTVGSIILTKENVSYEVVSSNEDVSTAGGSLLKVTSSSAPVEAFGVTGTGDAADTAALRRALSSEIPIFFDAKEYIIGDAIVVTDKNVQIISSPLATLKYTTALSQIRLFYTYTNEQVVSVVDNTASINMSDGIGSTATPCTMLTVLDGSQYARFDVLKIVADDLILGSDPADNNRIGESAVVFSVSGNDIYLDRRLKANGGVYSTNVRVAKASEKKCKLGAIKVNGDYENNTSHSGAHVRVIGCSELEARGYNSKKTKGPVIGVVSCHAPMIDDFYAIDGKTDAGIGAFGHCILFTGCTDPTVGRVYGNNMRHLVDTSANDISVGSEIWEYGGTIDGRASVVHGVGMQAPPASAHSDADNFIYENVTSLKPIFGPNGYAGAVGFRGRNCKVLNVVAEDGDGVRCFSDYADANNSRDHVIGKVKLISSGLHNQGRAVRVFGKSGGLVSNIVADDVLMLADGNKSAAIRAVYGNILVRNLSIQGNCASNDIDLIDVDESATVEVMNLTGRNMGLFSVVDIKDATGVCTIHKADLETDQTWGYFADLNGADGKFILKSAVVSVNGSAIDLVKNIGAGATVLTDWVITASQNDDRSRNRLATITADTATAYDIDIGDRLTPLIFINVLTTIAGASIEGISNGNFFGQEIIISNKPESTFSIDLVNDGGGFNLDSTITINNTGSVRGFWDGFAWRRST